MNTKRIISCILFLASCFLPLDSYAFSWSEPVNIDSGSSNAYRTDIAFDKRGNAIAVFEQKSGDIYRIFANRYVNGSGWQKPVTIDTGTGNAYRAQVSFDSKGNAIAVFKQADRVFANRYTYNEGWQGPVPIDNGAGNADGQNIVFDSKGNATAVFEEHNGKEFGIYVNFYTIEGWHRPFRIDSGLGDAFFPYAIFDDKDNLYVIYYKEESGMLEVYVRRIKMQDARNQLQEAGGEVTVRISDSLCCHELTPDSTLKEDKWDEDKRYAKNWYEKNSGVRKGIKAVYNPIHLSELKKRIYSGGYSYSRWETPSKIDSRFRDTYRPTLLVNKNGEVTALFIRWDGEYSSAYTAIYRNGKWGKPEDIDAGRGDVEHIRGTINSDGEMAIIFGQRVDNKQDARSNGNLRIHTRLYSPDYGWGEAKIIDAGEEDGFGSIVVFTDRGEIIAVWCQWEKAIVKSYANIYRKGLGWGMAEKLEKSDDETCGLRIVSGPDGRIIAIFEREEGFQEARGNRTYRIFAVEYIVNSQSSIVNQRRAIP